MPKIYKKYITVNGLKVGYRKKKNGVYEARRQIEKKPIYASSKSLETLRADILDQLLHLRSTSRQHPSVDRTVKFTTYFEEWLDTVKKPDIKEKTYGDYKDCYERYIKPHFADVRLSYVRQNDCKRLLNELCEDGIKRTAQIVQLLLNGVFKYAQGDSLITVSPMANIKHTDYDADEGIPLTRAEEKWLVDELAARPTIRKQAYVFICFTGIRRSELSSIEIDDKWVHIVCSKQRKGKRIKQRKIPISPMLARVLPMIDIEVIKKLYPNGLTRHFHKLFPNHHLHELRHTFTTRAKECKIMPELVSLWDGHKGNGRGEDDTVTTKVYTHLWQYEELQLEEIKKYDYEY